MAANSPLMAEFSDHRWTDEATWTLISAWSHRFNRRRNLTESDWHDVAAVLNDGHGKDFRRTGSECKDHIERLVDKYKVERAEVEKSNGSFTSSWPFYSKIDGVFTVEKRDFPAEKPPPVVVELSDSDSDSDEFTAVGGLRRSDMAAERFTEIYAVVGEERRKSMEEFALGLGTQGIQLVKNAKDHLEKINLVKETGQNVTGRSEDKGMGSEKLDKSASLPAPVPVTSLRHKRKERNDETSSSQANGSNLEPEPLQKKISELSAMGKQMTKDFGAQGMQLVRDVQIQLKKIKKAQRTGSDVTIIREDEESEREQMKHLSISPGSASLTSFVLKRIERNDEASNYHAEPLRDEIKRNSSKIDVATIEKSLGQRPWILDRQLDDLGQPNLEHLVTDNPVKSSFPKGVVSGCSNGDNCQMVTGSRHPEEPCNPMIEDAPIFQPTEEEFRDTLKYIASIRPQAEQYGICRIVPPSSWQPPSVIKEKNVWETSKFSTIIEQIDELQYLHSKKTLNRINEKTKGKSRYSRLDYVPASGQSRGRGDPGASADDFGFEHGPEFTPHSFKEYADEFRRQYFSKKNVDTGLVDHSAMPQEQSAPSCEKIEGEYWRIVTNQTKKIQVLSGTNVERIVFGNGSPLQSDPLLIKKSAEYMESGWNLNNTAKLPGSLLAFESCGTPAISVPRFNIGMCFSSVCWKVEEHHLYSLRYTHLGATKIWYGIPGRYFLKCEAALKKAFPELSQCPSLFHKLASQLSPSILKSEGIPVYRCVQYPWQFVLIFPGSYYSGFDCGFNFSETVNFAPFDWLPYGQNSVDIYSELGRKTSISYDQLLMGAGMEAVRALWELSLLKKESERNIQWQSVCGKDGILTKAVKSRVKQERTRREHLCNSFQSRKMEKDFNLIVKRECSICFYDLYLSAAFCPCTSERYSCLIHSKQLCSCPWSSRIFLFRYEIIDLVELADALEGKPNSVLHWAKEHLGLDL